MTDLVFPFFLFAMGAAMALSFDRRRQAGEPPASLLRQAAMRGLKIIGIGLVLNAFPFGLPLDPGALHAFTLGKVVDSIAGLRLPGVLQRIGGCWLPASAIIFLVKSPRRRVAAGAGLILLYEIAMRAPLVPGWGRSSRSTRCCGPPPMRSSPADSRRHSWR